MTREQLIDKYVEAHADSRWMDAGDLRDLLDSFADELQEPSFPSDVDEAAEMHFETMEVLEHENIFDETHNKIFKAGAEWMKNKMLGEAFVHNDVVHDGRIELEGDPLPCLDAIILLPWPQFKPDDKVHIVILKNNENESK